MKEILRRLFIKPLLAFEILCATFLITVLALAMPLYVIQILNRYVSYGFHGTLITLTSGMLLAIVLQFAFRVLRTKMATAVNQGPNERLSLEVLTVIAAAKAAPLEQFEKPRIQEALNSVHAIQTVYDAQTLNAMVDAPFSLLFIGATYLLSPILALVALVCILAGLLTGWLSVRKSGIQNEQYLSETAGHRNLNYSAVNALETVRTTNAAPFLKKQWEKQLKIIAKLKSKITDTRELSQTLTLTGSSLTGVLIYAVGAVIVVQDELTVGGLIGANILVGRAYQTITRVIQSGFALSRVKSAFKEIDMLKRMPLEPAQGAMLRKYQGRITFQDIAFAYPGAVSPVFESLSLDIEPGSVLAVCGRTGTGKTTLAKLITGLMDPVRGHILADNVNLSQLAAPWWRSQLMYMPQEPSFINATIRETVGMANPVLDEAALNRIITLSDLKSFLNISPKGMETLITENAKTLPLGIRRRLSLAGALATDGQLVILDEPTDAMDEKGAQAVYTLMNELTRAGKTLIVFTNDPRILKGVSMILDLNVKPVPEFKKR